MLNKQIKETMNDINETMDNAIIEDDFNKIESIALNPKNALVRVHEFNMFTGQGRFVNKWVDVSSVINMHSMFNNANIFNQDIICISLSCLYKFCDFRINQIAHHPT